MTVLNLTKTAERLRAAEDAYDAALQGGNPDKIAAAQGRVMRAERAHTIAFHADEYGNCRCGTCTGRSSWDD